MQSSQDTKLTQEEAIIIALDDEFKAFETYKAIALKFQVQIPFGNIAEAEIRHIQALLNAANRLGILPPENRWTQVIPPNTLQESYLLGIEAEIANIALYDRLIPFVEDAQVRDIFYSLQAASFNNHLPAFQAHLQGGANASNPLDALINSIFSNGGEQLQEAKELMRRFSNNNLSLDELSNFLQGVNLPLFGGAILGGVGVYLLKELLEKNEIKKEEE